MRPILEMIGKHGNQAVDFSHLIYTGSQGDILLVKNFVIEHSLIHL